MKLNAEAFQRELNVFTKELLPADVHRFTKAIALQLFRGVIEKTPVGNPSLWKNPPPKGYVGGHARMNWQLSANAPVDTELPGASADTTAVLFAGMTQLNQSQPYQEIWICNNVPYITVLENGRGPDENGVLRGSTQAPYGMLGVTLEELRRDFA